jgi:hypothetical protein
MLEQSLTGAQLQLARQRLIATLPIAKDVPEAAKRQLEVGGSLAAVFAAVVNEDRQKCRSFFQAKACEQAIRDISYMTAALEFCFVRHDMQACKSFSEQCLRPARAPSGEAFQKFVHFPSRDEKALSVR